MSRALTPYLTRRRRRPRRCFRGGHGARRRPRPPHRGGRGRCRRAWKRRASRRPSLTPLDLYQFCQPVVQRLGGVREVGRVGSRLGLNLPFGGDLFAGVFQPRGREEGWEPVGGMRITPTNHPPTPLPGHRCVSALPPALSRNPETRSVGPFPRTRSMVRAGARRCPCPASTTVKL